MASDVAFFKGVDDSVHLYSQYSDHPVYYYNYAHKGQYRVDMVLGSPPDFDYGNQFKNKRPIINFFNSFQIF